VSGLAAALLDELGPDELRELAERLRPYLRGREAGTSEWLNAREAAAYLRCPLSRVRKLSMTGELGVERDGRRVLYHRDVLDAYIRAGGAKSP